MKTHSGIHVVELVIILGGDHGIGAFRIPFRTLVLLRDGTILKKDIGIATVMSKKDSAKVFQNTVEPWLTADLKTINQSQVILTTDVSGFVQCTFLPKDEYQNNNVFSKHIESVHLYITGDIKWYCCCWGWKIWLQSIVFIVYSVLQSGKYLTIPREWSTLLIV